MPEKKWSPEVDGIVEEFRDACGKDEFDGFRPYMSHDLQEALLSNVVMKYIIIRSEHHPDDPIGPFVETFFDASEVLGIEQND